MASHSPSVLRLSLAIVLALLVSLAAGGGRPAQAAPFTVTKTADTADGTCDADCSLREAIIAANGAGGPLITLPAGTYTLSIPGTGEDAAADGDLDITDDITITGAGAGTTTIVGNSGVTGERVFHIDPSFTGITVEISGVTVRDGDSPSDGGAFWNEGNPAATTLALTDVIVTANTAFGGGGIKNESTLTLIDSTVSGNTADPSDGGGISNNGTLSITSSTISGNTAPSASGGGIYSEVGGITLVDSTVISGNTASSGGGGVWNSGTLTLIDVAVSGNTADDRGGGIHNGFNGTVTVTDSVLNGNTGFTAGGGISNGDVDSPGTLTLTNVTISGNAGSSGAGINVFLGSTATLTNVTISGNTGDVGGGITSGGAATLKNTIVANSVSGSDCNGAITSNGNNLDSDGTCGFAAAGDLPGTDPVLGPLADNGGPTQTLALLSGSPAIDAGDDASCPAADQRGVARPVDGDEDGTANCDIGAYEYELPPEPTPTPTPTATPVGLPETGGEPASGGGAWTVAIVLLAAGALGLAGVGGALAGVRRRS